MVVSSLACVLIATTGREQGATRASSQCAPEHFGPRQGLHVVYSIAFLSMHLQLRIRVLIETVRSEGRKVTLNESAGFPRVIYPNIQTFVTVVKGFKLLLGTSFSFSVCVTGQVHIW